MQINEISKQDITIQAINLLGLKHKGKLSASSKEVMVSCPFHSDSSPSCGVNLESGIYHCFSCGRSGSISSLSKELTGQNLYKLLGIQSDSFSSYAYKQQSFKNFKFDDFTKSKNVYVNMDSSSFIDAYSNSNCATYLTRRGITRDVAKAMKMQYVEDTYINTTHFYQRLLIPIYEDNQLKSIEGRRIFDENPAPKVLYPKNCSTSTLYDIDNLDRSKPIYAVEGLMDLAVLRSADTFKNSTAIFGASLTDRQLQLIKTFDQFIYIPDLDEAGQKTIDKLKESGLGNLYVLKLPDSINDIKIKDVGDVPKTGITIEDLINRKWLSYLKKIN